jgi:hypothetical protein
MHHFKQGDWEDAETFLKRAADIIKQVAGDQNPEYIATLNNLAITYLQRERWSDAEQALRTTLELTKRVLGEQHPTTLLCTNNLAVACIGARQSQRAERLLLGVSATGKRVFGTRHLVTSVSANNLKNIYLDHHGGPVLLATVIATTSPHNRPPAYPGLQDLDLGLLGKIGVMWVLAKQLVAVAIWCYVLLEVIREAWKCFKSFFQLVSWGIWFFYRMLSFMFVLLNFMAFTSQVWGLVFG